MNILKEVDGLIFLISYLFKELILFAQYKERWGIQS